MKKVILMAMVISSGLSVFAVGTGDIGSVGDSKVITVTDRANLHTFKMSLELSSDRLNTLTSEGVDAEKEFNQLGFFSFGQKNKIGQEYCANAKASIASGLLFMSTALEQAKDSFEKIEFSELDSNNLQMSLTSMIAESKSAMENCINISQSIKSVQAAKAASESSLEILNKVLPKLIE